MTLSQGLRIRPTFTVTNHFNNSEHSSCGFKSFLDFIIPLVVSKIDILWRTLTKKGKLSIFYGRLKPKVVKSDWKLMYLDWNRSLRWYFDFLQIWCDFVFLSDLAWPWKYGILYVNCLGFLREFKNWFPKFVLLFTLFTIENYWSWFNFVKFSKLVWHSMFN